MEVNMGIFDFIGKKYNDMKKEMMDAEKKAEEWDERRICDEMDRCSNMTRCMGYANVLKKKCREMNDERLIDIFEEVIYRRNAKAYNILVQVMINRGLGHKDEDGRFQKDY